MATPTERLAADRMAMHCVARQSPFRRGLRPAAGVGAWLVGLACGGCGGPPTASPEAPARAGDSPAVAVADRPREGAVPAPVAERGSVSEPFAAEPRGSGPPLASAAGSGELPRPLGPAEALERLIRSAKTGPAGVERLARVAWVLATYPDPRARDGRAALRLLEVVSDESSFERARLDRLVAAARAEAGDWEAAVAAAHAGARRAEAAGETELAAALGAQARLHEGRLPHRESPLANLGQEVFRGGSDRASILFAIALVAESAAREGQTDESLGLFRVLREIDASYALPRLRLGRALAGAGKLRAAVEELEAAVWASRGDADAWQQLGQVYQQAGQARRAVACYRQAIELEPGWATAPNNLAWLLATHPEAALRDGAEASRLAERICETTKRKNPYYLSTLAAAHAEQGRFVEACADADAALALALAGQHEALAQTVRQHRWLFEAERPLREGLEAAFPAALEAADWHVSWARGLLRGGEAELAGRHLRAAVRRKPLHAEALNTLGMLAVQEGRYAASVALYARANRARPGWPLAAANLAWVLAAAPDARVRQPEEALHLARLAVESQPGEWSHWDTLGVAEAACLRFDDAAAATAQALERAQRSGAARRNREAIEIRRASYLKGNAFQDPPPEHPPETPADAYAEALGELGLLAVLQGRGKAAEPWLEAALAQRPEQAEWLDNLGLARLQQGRLQEAIEAHRAARRADAESRDIANNLAWALAAQREVSPVDAALAVELARFAIGPDRAAASPAVADTLASAYAAAGRFEEAAATLAGIVARLREEEATGLAARLAQRQAEYAAGRRHETDLDEMLAFHPAYRGFHVQQGMAQLAAGEHAQALRHFRGALAAWPDAEVTTQVGVALQGLKQYREARQAYEAALKLNARHTPAINNLAWLLATCPDFDAAPQALLLAREAAEGVQYRDPAVLDTLSVAYAACGQYYDAVMTCRLALARAREQRDVPLAAQIESHLKRFQGERPLRLEAEGAHAPPPDEGRK